MSDNTIYGFNRNIHEISEHIINHHVIINQTSLVNDLCASGKSICGITWDNITALYRDSYYGDVMEW